MPLEIDLVRSPDEVTVLWLDRVLSACDLSKAGALSRFEATPIGTGKVGEIVRFDLWWRGGRHGPASVIGKFAARDEASRRAGLLTGTYVREVSFYRRFAESAALRIPACHGVAFDPGSGDFVLVLEDLRDAEAGDQMRGCRVDAAAHALESIAGLHAAHFGSAALRREGWLSTRSEGGGEGLAAVYDTLVDPFVKCFATRLAPAVLETASRLKGRVAEWIARDRAPFTLVHGDYRVENLMFGGPRSDFAVAVVDWQTVAIGPGLCDVSYFLGAGLPLEARRAHEAALVRLYVDAMAARGIALDPDVSFEEYRLHAFAGLHMAVVASQLVGRDPRSDEMFCTMAERHAAQIDDLDAFALLAA